MKNPVRSLIVIAIAASAGLIAQAQPAPKICVVDVQKVFQAHPEYEKQTAKLKVDGQKAKETEDMLNKEGNEIYKQIQELNEQLKNPATTDEAKKKTEEAAQLKVQEFQRKQQEFESFRQNTARSLQTRAANFQTILLEEIQKHVTDITKKKGANMAVDKSLLLYADTSFDITDEVLAEIMKNRPATPAPAPSASTPTATPAAPAAAPASEPVIKVPGAK